MEDVSPPRRMHRVGLRFDRAEAVKLKRLADRAKAKDLKADVSVYEQAQLAAETGEPLVLICSSIDEAYGVIAGFIMHGVKRPALEDLG